MAAKCVIFSSLSPCRLYSVTIFFFLLFVAQNTDAMLRSYFSLENCLTGISLVCREVFNVDLVRSPVQAGEVHHESVFKFKVVDRDVGLLGTIYCDLFARPSKTLRGAAHLTIQTGRINPGSHDQLPVVVLVFFFFSFPLFWLLGVHSFSPHLNSFFVLQGLLHVSAATKSHT